MNENEKSITKSDYFIGALIRTANFVMLKESLRSEGTFSCETNASSDKSTLQLNS